MANSRNATHQDPRRQPILRTDHKCLSLTTFYATEQRVHCPLMLYAPVVLPSALSASSESKRASAEIKKELRVLSFTNAHNAFHLLPLDTRPHLWRDITYPCSKRPMSMRVHWKHTRVAHRPGDLVRRKAAKAT